MGEWRYITLGEVIELKRGYDLSASQRREGKVPIISSSGPSGFHDEAKVRGPGVVTGRCGTVGQVFYVEDDFWPLNTSLYVRDFKGNRPRFIYYLLQLIDWIGFNDKSGVPGINRNDVHMSHVVLADKDEQKIIEEFLGILDDKIELNRQTNETLESMARTLFKDWFVDFGPTRAKMHGCTPYLTADFWSLFPDRLDIQTGLPEGWEVFRLCDLVKHHKRTLTPSEFPGTIFELFSIPAFNKEQTPALDLGETIRSNKTIVPEMSILLSKLNPEVSRVWLPELPSDYKQISSTEFLAFTAKEPAGRSLLYCLMRDNGFRAMLQSMVTGTIHQRVSPPSLLEREVICGQTDIFNHFESIASSLLGPVLANRAEARTLAQTRNLLLPKLITGEIRLLEAERIIGDVL